MYCSSCGGVVTSGVSYCNRCGVSLIAKEKSANKLSEMPLENLVWATVAVSVPGLGVLIGLMALMKQALHFNNSLIIAFSLLAFLLLVGAESVFIWLLIRSQKIAKEADDITQLKAPVTRELGEAQTPMLNEPAISIVEHTTRTLNPVHIKNTPE